MQIGVDARTMVRGLSVAEMKELKGVIEQRLLEISQIFLLDSEKEAAHQNKMTAMRMLRDRTGLSLLDAKVAVEGFLNGSATEGFADSLRFNGDKN